MLLDGVGVPLHFKLLGGVVLDRLKVEDGVDARLVLRVGRVVHRPPVLGAPLAHHHRARCAHARLARQNTTRDTGMFLHPLCGDL